MSGLSHSERGRLGGIATREKHGREHLRKVASKGGHETAARHSDKLSKWGKKGQQAVIERYFGGDREAFHAWLSAYSNWANDPAPWNGAFKCPGSFPGPEGHAPGYIPLDQIEEEWEREFLQQAALDHLRRAGKLPAPPFEIQTGEDCHECPV
jgi:hypothetical protein